MQFSPDPLVHMKYSQLIAEKLLAQDCFKMELCYDGYAQTQVKLFGRAQLND